MVLVGAGVGGELGVEEVLLEGGLGSGGGGFLFGGGGDDGNELEVGDGGAGDEDALGIGADVRWGEGETVIENEVVEEAGVGGG